MLELNGIVKSYYQGKNEVKVLKGLDLSLSKGESLAILGQSGSGKSTLLSLLCGLDQPDKGSLTLNGVNFKSLSEDELTVLRSKKIGIIFQNFHLLPHLSALENVSLPQEVLGDRNAKTQAAELLQKVGLADRLNHFPGQLSGGEKQRVAIARALSIGPELILADEPSGSLDEKTGEAIMKLMFDLIKERESSLILVTHNIELAKSCQKVMNLQNGKLSELEC